MSLNLRTEVLAHRDDGFPDGYSLGWDCLDPLLKVVPTNCTAITGIPTHGKSNIADSILVNTIKRHDWKWAVYSPENFPIRIHLQSLTEKILKKPFFLAKREDLEAAGQIIQNNVTYLGTGEEILTLKELLSIFKEKMQERGLNALLIDPWNEVDIGNSSDTEVIGKALRFINRFTKANNICTFIVVHPIKIQKDQQGKFIKPNPYSIEGSRHWYGKMDNIICVYREDQDGKPVEIDVQKVKWKYYGRKGQANLLFDTITGTYKELETDDNGRELYYSAED